jgi:hypothetical protein
MMQVKDLIEVLKRMPQDLGIVGMDDDYGEFKIDSVRIDASSALVVIDMRGPYPDFDSND